jgi:peptidoglycan-associated lipoprotein
MRLGGSVKYAVALALVAAAAAQLGGCASRPKPMPMTFAPPPRAPYAPPAPARPSEPAQSDVLPGSLKDFVVNVGDRIYFDLDRFEVRADAVPVLSSQAAWLIRYPSVEVRIEGNCDERGTREYNLALGARRAEAVKALLVAHGVGPSRIATISFGKERPSDAGSGEAAWQHNRNAHTAIIGGAH